MKKISNNRKHNTRKIQLNFINYLFVIFIFLVLVLLTFVYKKFIEKKDINVGSHIQGANTKLEDPIDKIESELEKYTEKELFSGSILVAKDGKILLRRGYGYSDKDNKFKNTPDTKYRLGSLTKAFTAMGIMVLYDKKLLDIEDPVSKFIPDFKNGKNIKVKHLLTHQSGVKNYFYGYTKAENPVTTKDLVSIINKQGINFNPGEKFEYSNSNYVLLTFIIERVSGKSYEEFLKENIFEPLNMKNTGYDQNDESPNKAKGYTLKNNKVIDAEYIDMTYASGTGGLYSTVDDMYRWDQALYSNKIVSRNVMEKIFKPDKLGYAYGWNIKPFSINGKTTKLIWHEGLISGFTSYIYRYVDEKLTIVILRNMEPNKLDPGDLVNKIYWGQNYTLGENDWFLDFE